MTIPIIKAAADYFGVSADDILSARRYGFLIPPRAAVAYVLRTRDSLSFPAIGRAIGGRDQSTVQHLVKNVAGRLLDDPEFAAFVRAQIRQPGAAITAPVRAVPVPLPEDICEPLHLEWFDANGRVFTLDQHGRSREDRFERRNVIRGSRMLEKALREALAA